ncbi:MAG: hypothetical protein V5B36_05845 [Candidatus Accumulibacter sp. UW25]|jgi:hypothetical protein
MTQAIEPSIVNKKGNINKCPNCGASLGAFLSVCESCGHEITDIEANRTITALVEKFDAIEREVDEKQFVGRRREQAILERRSRVIRDYPIPNSREDLQQLLYFIQPKLVESVKPDPNVEDWRAKFTEVLNRAKNAYKNDSHALAEFAHIEKSLDISLSENLTIKAKRNPVFVTLLAGVVVLMMIGLGFSQMERFKLQQCEEKYTQGAQDEQSRLEKIYAVTDLDFKSKKFTEALASSATLRWEFEATTCKTEENQKIKTLWEDKRNQIAALINKGADTAAAEKEAEIKRLAAEKDAEANRIIAEKQAETAKVTGLARIEAEKQWAKAAEAKRVVNEAKW